VRGAYSFEARDVELHATLGDLPVFHPETMTHTHTHTQCVCVGYLNFVPFRKEIDGNP
jgi:hypothetical protein